MISTNEVYVGYLDSGKQSFLKQPLVFSHFRWWKATLLFLVNFLRFLYFLCPQGEVFNICQLSFQDRFMLVFFAYHSEKCRGLDLLCNPLQVLNKVPLKGIGTYVEMPPDHAWRHFYFNTLRKQEKHRMIHQLAQGLIVN